MIARDLSMTYSEYMHRISNVERVRWHVLYEIEAEEREAAAE